MKLDDAIEQRFDYPLRRRLRQRMHAKSQMVAMVALDDPSKQSFLAFEGLVQAGLRESRRFLKIG